MTLDLDELERYAKGLADSGEMDGYAYAGIVTPQIVLALIERVRELERKRTGVIDYVRPAKAHGGGMRAVCERIEEMLNGE